MIRMKSGTPSAKDSAADIFQSEWSLYRKMIDHNYLFHREAYSCLRRVLLEDAARPFRFLDLACGDASATAAGLRQPGSSAWAAAISGISGVGAKPSSAGARTAWASTGRPVD
jgi:hypothetical protein